MKKFLLALLIGTLLIAFDCALTFAQGCENPDPNMLDPDEWSGGTEVFPGVYRIGDPGDPAVIGTSYMTLAAGTYSITITYSDTAYLDTIDLWLYGSGPTGYNCYVSVGMDYPDGTKTCTVQVPADDYQVEARYSKASDTIDVDYLCVELAALSPTPTPTGTPTPSPTPNDFGVVGGLAATPIAATVQALQVSGTYTAPVDIPIPVTPTPPVQCLDPNYLRGLLFHDLVTSTNTILDGPRSYAVVMRTSFAEETSRSYGREIGGAAGSFFGMLTSLYTTLSTIIPFDVAITMGVRLLLFLLFAFVGLIGKLKTVLKWW